MQVYNWTKFGLLHYFSLPRWLPSANDISGVLTRCPVAGLCAMLWQRGDVVPVRTSTTHYLSAHAA